MLKKRSGVPQQRRSSSSSLLHLFQTAVVGVLTELKH